MLILATFVGEYENRVFILATFVGEYENRVLILVTLLLKYENRVLILATFVTQIRESSAPSLILSSNTHLQAECR